MDMTDKETIEGDEIIAIFDGYEKEGEKFWRNHAWTTISGLKYHSDWSRLMPVVEKISLGYALFRLIIGNVNSTAHFEVDDEFPLHRSTTDKTIETVWKQVIQFIKWHNQGENDERNATQQTINHGTEPL